MKKKKIKISDHGYKKLSQNLRNKIETNLNATITWEEVFKQCKHLKGKYYG